MRIFCKKTFRRAFLCLALFLGAILVLDGWMEIVGLPRFCVRIGANKLEQFCGGKATISRIRLGLFNGLFLHNARLEFPMGELGKLYVQAESLHLEFRHFLPSSKLSDLRRLDILNLRCRAPLHPDLTGRLETLRLDASGNRGKCSATIESRGTHLYADFELRHLQDLRRKIRQWEQEAGGSFTRQQLESCLKTAGDYWGKFQAEWDDTFIRIYGSIDGRETPWIRAKGQFQVGRSSFDGFAVEQARGEIHISPETLKLGPLKWTIDQTSNQELLDEVTFFWKTRQWSRQLKGQAYPLTILRFCDVRLSAEVEKCLGDIRTLLDFHLDVPPSTFEWEDLKADMEFSLSRLPLGQWMLPRVQAALHLENGVLSLGNLEIALTENDDQNRLTASGTWDIQGDELRLQADGQAFPLSIFPFLRKKCPSSIASILENMLCSARMTLQGKPKQDGLHGLQSHLTADIPDFTVGDVAISGIHGEATLQNAQLQVAANLRAQGTAQAIQVTLRTGNSKARQENRQIWKLPLLLSVKLADGTPVLNWTGNCQWDFKRALLSGDGQADVLLDKIQKDFLNGISYPGDAFVGLTHLEGNPIHMTMQVPPFSPGKDEFSIQGTLQASQVNYGLFHATDIQCDFQSDEDHLRISNIQGKTASGKNASLDLYFRYTPFLARIRNLHFCDSPAIAEQFLFDKGAMRFYRKFWQGLQWDTPPEIFIQEMVYETDLNRPDWTFTMTNGSLRSGQGTYNGVPFQALSGKIAVSLPTDMQMTDLRVELPETVMQGSCSFSFSGVPQCRFAVSSLQGKIDMEQLLTHILLNKEEVVGKFTLSQGSSLSCHGAFYLEGPPSLFMQGKISSPQCEFQDWTLKDLQGAWNVTNDSVNWDLQQAKFLNGNIQATGTFQLNSRLGNILARAENLQLASIIRQLDPAPQKGEGIPASGLLDSECHITLTHNWAGRKWDIHGTGHVSLHDANILEIPFFKSLKGVLGQKMSFGQISALFARLDFTGGKLVVPEFFTDGTLLALSGKGVYSFEDDKIRFTVDGDPLKKISLLSYLLRPFARAFHAELTGSSKERHWHIRTPLHWLFSWL